MSKNLKFSWKSKSIEIENSIQCLNQIRSQLETESNQLIIAWNMRSFVCFDT